ncbi:PRTRC system ThiF family protein [Rhodanobacter denitrificans]|uniref:PRTRC system ThiF family protein n=2 Tax=Pseudomonadota TaxID=1224 RepID=M4NE88_9GAMM|nr:PRTRC system ThiF family protein [Rhodanobacter denitrificans]AGG89049.1 PRTRC system ThiF family protein [Rhodanobacter denitrificans]UJJ53077.1 PRTRC system ThiF family protein [Rhodanobacter denitrificans]
MSAQRFPTPEAFLGDRPIRVLLAGAGGNGSMLADGLARLDCALRAQGHPGMAVTVYDDALVREANIGRQRFTHVDVGHPKATLLVHRLNGFYGVSWEAEVQRLPESPPRADLVIGCVDLGWYRHALGKANAKRQTDALYLDLGNGASRGQVFLGHLGQPQSGLRLPNIYDLYGDGLLTGDDGDLPSCSLAEALTRQRWSINPLVAQVALTMLDDLLHRGGLDVHGAYVRLDPLSVTSLPIDPEQWKLLGYQP